MPKQMYANLRRGKENQEEDAGDGDALVRKAFFGNRCKPTEATTTKAGQSVPIGNAARPSSPSKTSQN